MNEIKRLQQLAGITEIKINNPNIITAYTADRENTEVKVRILEKFWEEKGDKMFWGEYPKGILDLVIYSKIDDDYSVDHEQGLDELVDDYIEGNPYQLYKNALLKYKLKPSFQNHFLDEKIEEWEEYNNLEEIKVNKPIRVWDFNKYIPNFNPKNIQVNDRLIIPVKPYWDNLVGFNGKITKIVGDKYYYNENGLFDSLYLTKINNENK